MSNHHKTPSATLITLAHQAFEALYNDLHRVKTIPYAPRWATGTGTLDGAVRDTSITEVVRSGDRNGRRILIIPVPGLANVVYSDRSIPGQSELIFSAICDFGFCLDLADRPALARLSLAVGGTEGGLLRDGEAVSVMLISMAKMYGYSFEPGALLDVLA